MAYSSLVTFVDDIENRYKSYSDRYGEIVHGNLGGNLVELMLDRASKEAENPLRPQASLEESLIKKIGKAAGTILATTLDAAGTSFQEMLQKSSKGSPRWRLLNAINYLLGLVPDTSPSSASGVVALVPLAADASSGGLGSIKDAVVPVAVAIVRPVAAVAYSASECVASAGAGLVRRHVNGAVERLLSVPLPTLFGGGVYAGESSGLMGMAYQAVTPVVRHPEEFEELSSEEIAAAKRADTHHSVEKLRLEREARERALQERRRVEAEDAARARREEELAALVKSLREERARIDAAKETHLPEVAILETALKLNRFEKQRYLTEFTLSSVPAVFWYLIAAYKSWHEGATWSESVIHASFQGVWATTGFIALGTSMGFPDVFTVGLSTPKKITYLLYRAAFLAFFAAMSLVYPKQPVGEDVNQFCTRMLIIAFITCALAQIFISQFNLFLEQSLLRKLEAEKARSTMQAKRDMALLDARLREATGALAALGKRVA